MKNKFLNAFLIAILAIFIGINCYMLFHRLGSGYLIQTDEAYHATNAYEMFKQGNWIINTYRYAADYFNSKPPLCLDLMIVSYKLFGVSGFAARFPSALGGMLLCLLVVAFFIYRKKFYSAALFSALICACSGLYTFHMFRAAEMDSVYNLFFALAMLSLYLMQEKPDFMYLYGLFLGLAFMCKGPHAALIFIIGLLFIPRIKEAFFSIKRVVISVLLAAIIPLAWMAKRFMFDGFELLNALFVGEVSDRVAGADQEAMLPITDFFTSHIFIIFVAIAVITVVLMFISAKTFKEDNKGVIKELLLDNYLFIIWAVVPVAFFALTKSYLDWYAYTSQIAMCILIANLLDFCVVRLMKENIVCAVVVALITMALSLVFVVPCIRDYINPAGTGGHPVDEFTEDMQAFAAEYGDTYSGVNAYLISDFRINKSVEDHWEPEYVAPAEMYCDLIAVDGTVDNFLSDPNSILIIDKDRWDEFSSALSGHVILQDKSYFIFSHDMY